MERLLNMVLRGCLGMVGIYFCNVMLMSQGYTCFGAINIVTFMLCSLLGVPGVLVVLFITYIRIMSGI